MYKREKFMWKNQYNHYLNICLFPYFVCQTVSNLCKCLCLQFVSIAKVVPVINLHLTTTPSHCLPDHDFANHHPNRTFQNSIMGSKVSENIFIRLLVIELETMPHSSPRSDLKPEQCANQSSECYIHISETQKVIENSHHTIKIDTQFCGLMVLLFSV